MKKAKTILAFALSAVLALSLFGCKGKTPVPVKKDDDAVKTAENYPVKIGTTEIVLGSTTMQALYDAGYTIEAPESDANGQLIEGVTGKFEPDYEWKANESYEGFWVVKDGVKQAEVDVKSGNTKCTLADTKIIGFSVDYSADQPTETITFAGIDLNDLTMDAFAEAVDGSVDKEANTGTGHLENGFSANVYWGKNGAVEAFDIGIDS